MVDSLGASSFYCVPPVASRAVMLCCCYLGFLKKARLRDGLKLIPTLPNDPEVLHSMGVGLAHKGIDALNREGPGVRAVCLLCLLACLPACPRSVITLTFFCSLATLKFVIFISRDAACCFTIWGQKHAEMVGNPRGEKIDCIIGCLRFFFSPDPLCE